MASSLHNGTFLILRGENKVMENWKLRSLWCFWLASFAALQSEANELFTEADSEHPASGDPPTVLKRTLSRQGCNQLIQRVLWWGVNWDNIASHFLENYIIMNVFRGNLIKHLLASSCVDLCLYFGWLIVNAACLHGFAELIVRHFRWHSRYIPGNIFWGKLLSVTLDLMAWDLYKRLLLGCFGFRRVFPVTKVNLILCQSKWLIR